MGYLHRLRNNNGYLYSEAMNALLLLGEAAVCPIIAALEAGDRMTRYHAAVVLGRLHDRRACGPLMSALRGTDAQVRSGAAYALGELGDARAVPALIVALRDPDRPVRRLAAEALGKLEDDTAVLPLIAAFRTEEIGSAVHKQVAEALARLGEMALPPLIAALTDRDRAVRAGAARALGQLGDRRAVVPLIAALQRDEREVDVLCNLIKALSDLGDRQAVEALIEMLKIAGSTWVVHCYVVSTLGLLGDSRAVAPLVELLVEETTDCDVRCSAATALGRLGDLRAMFPLIRCLQNPDNGWDLRSRAAVALGDLGDARAIEPLRDALLDSNTRVRQVATRALHTLNPNYADVRMPSRAPGIDFERKSQKGVPVVNGNVRQSVQRGQTTSAEAGPIAEELMHLLRAQPGRIEAVVEMRTAVRGSLSPSTQPRPNLIQRLHSLVTRLFVRLH